MDSIPYYRNPVYQQKASLVDLGIYFLSHGDWQAVMAITRLIEKGGMRHA